jgi:hypothetical protein
LPDNLSGKVVLKVMKELLSETVVRRAANKLKKYDQLMKVLPENVPTENVMTILQECLSGDLAGEAAAMLFRETSLLKVCPFVRRKTMSYDGRLNWYSV